jgi:SSS family solute:Na+ symporter
MNHWIAATIVALYIALLFVATWWARRLTLRGAGGAIGYLLADRALPPIVSAFLLAGLAVGGASTIGVAESAYKFGISAGWYNAAWAAGAAILGLVSAKRYRAMNITTLPELFERYYSKTGRVIGVIGQLIIQIVVTSLQYVAGGAILSSLMPQFFTLQSGMVVSAIVFVGITLIGGYWAAGLTNVINVIVIYVGIGLGVILTISHLGGLSAFANQIPKSHPGFDLFAIGPGMIAAWFMVMITMTHSVQSVIQIGFATRSPKSATTGYLLGSVLIFPVGFLAALIGMAAVILYPNIEATEALPKVVLGFSPWAAGVILSGLWAADVSTASALLLGSATLVTNDLIRPFFMPNMDKRKEQMVCYLTLLGTSVLTFLLALTVSGILKVLLIGLTLSTAYTLLVIMTMYWPRLCRKSSATWTLLLTMIALGFWLVMPKEWQFLPHPIYFTWLVSIVVFLLVAVFDKHHISSVE